MTKIKRTLKSILRNCLQTVHISYPWMGTLLSRGATVQQNPKIRIWTAKNEHKQFKNQDYCSKVSNPSAEKSFALDLPHLLIHTAPPLHLPKKKVPDCQSSGADCCSTSTHPHHVVLTFWLAIVVPELKVMLCLQAQLSHSSLCLSQHSFLLAWKKEKLHVNTSAGWCCRALHTLDKLILFTANALPDKI